MTVSPVPSPQIAESPAPITADELRAAIRLGETPEETAQAERLLRVSWTLVRRYAPEAPAAIQEEAIVRVAGYLFDAPAAASGTGYANAMRNSGAVSLLLPWRAHGLGSTAAGAPP